jgi:hypothetical protein
MDGKEESSNVHDLGRTGRRVFLLRRYLFVCFWIAVWDFGNGAFIHTFHIDEGNSNGKNDNSMLLILSPFAF